MKTTLLPFVFSTVMLLAPSLAANPDAIQEQLKGTWSGGWIPEGGVRDAMTIELRFEESGKLTGRFVTPVSMNFTRATFNAKTRALLLEAADATSGKQYKLNGKVEGTEIKGTVAADNQGGQVHLIKWTYVPPIR
ncbi:MAG TPA: hypothetical protein VFR18_15315 [Terriglobia bacterium]|nr:hypothetical protein [Terriglobia bacterium]